MNQPADKQLPSSEDKPDELVQLRRSFIDFLSGGAPHPDTGRWFGEDADGARGAFWWRRFVRAEIERNSALPELQQRKPDAYLWTDTAGHKTVSLSPQPYSEEDMAEYELRSEPLFLAAPVYARPFTTDKTSSDYVPLCDGHAASWFTERNHLKGGMDAECVVCAFDPVSTNGRSESFGPYTHPDNDPDHDFEGRRK